MDFNRQLQLRINALSAQGLWRVSTAGSEASGSEVLDLTSNDYLGVARRGVSRETLLRAKGCPLGSGSSRVVADQDGEARKLEAVLAQWLGYEASLIFTSGYAANLGVIAAMVQVGDRIVSDALNHASIVDACRLSRAEVVVTPHLDLQQVEVAIAGYEGGGTCWVVTESYFSMEGDSPDLPGLQELCSQSGAQLIVDESHALGVFGKDGSGLCALLKVRPTVIVAGLGKAVASQGGFAACSLPARAWLWNQARTHFFSTGMSPLLAFLTREAVGRVQGADREREYLDKIGQRLQISLERAGWRLPYGRHGPLFPLLLAEPQQTLDLAFALKARGVKVQAIRPPTVPTGLCRLRLALRADISEQELQALVERLVELAPREFAVGAAKTPSLAQVGVVGSMSIDAGTSPSGVSSNIVQRWVVLGCGTDVGKTFVATAMVEHLRKRGSAVAGLKPIETGQGEPSGEACVSGDALLLSNVSCHVKHPFPHPLYRYEQAVTPSRAARIAGRPISLERVQAWVEETRSESEHDEPVLVIETAGGVFSPIGPNQTNLDLAKCLGSSQWVLVAVDRLGVLHELAATLRALAATGRSPDWVILTSPEHGDSSTGTNEEELRRSPELAQLLRHLILLPRDDPSALARLFAG